MDFAFSDEQQELRRSAKRFLQNVSSTEHVITAMQTERGYDPELYQRMATELGWTALTIPEHHGGLGMTPLDLHPLMEEMGRHLLCSPFFSTVCLGANALITAGTEPQQQKWLPQIAEGQITATLAYAGDNTAVDPNNVQLTVAPSDGGYAISGQARYVINGHTADLLVVAARTPGSDGARGVGLFLVPADTGGVTRQRVPTMDQTRKLATVTFDNVLVSADAAMGGPDEQWPALQRTLDLAITAMAAEQVGATERCLDMAVEYAGVRKQFGRPIGQFQAIKHKCADMLVQTECARSAAFYASAIAATEPDNLSENASSAKAFCSEALMQNAAENVQIHGGIGFTWEGAPHVYFKRARSSGMLFGTPTHHHERIAQLMDL